MSSEEKVRGEAASHLVLAVCTANRPKMLKRCVESLTRLTLPPGVTAEIVVVENETPPRAAGIVAEIANRTGWSIRHVVEPRRGIPFARNRAIEEAIEGPCDWIALIDDDEVAKADWLVKHYTACQEHGAQVSTGPVRRIYHKPPPHWWKTQQFEMLPTGTPVREASTNNVLLSAHIVRKEGFGVRFDNRLTYGNEDLDFFRLAHRAGAKMIWVPDAWVEEEIPASRVRARRLLGRVLMASSSASQNVVIRDGSWYAARRFIPKAIRRLVLGGIAAIVGALVVPFNRVRGEKILFYGVSRVLKGIGNIRGLCNISHNYYNTVDGY